MTTQLRVLLHPNDKLIEQRLSSLLSEAGYQPVFQSAGSDEELDEALRDGGVDLVLSGTGTGGAGPEALLAKVRRLASHAPVVIASGGHTEHSALHAVRAGAHDCVPLDDEHRLAAAVIRAARESRRDQGEEFSKSRVFETNFMQLFENSTEAIAIVDPDEKVMDVNQSFVDLFFFTRGEIKGKRISDVIIPEGKHEEYSSLRDQIYGGRLIRRETTRLRKDGSQVRVSVIGCPIVFQDRTHGVYAIYSDITRQMKALQTLRQAESNFRNFFKNALEGMYISTPSGRFMTVNPAMAELLGYDSPNDLADTVKSIAKEVYVKPDTRETMLALLKEREKIRNFRSSVRRKDGRILEVCENILAVRDEDGDLLYYQGTMQPFEDTDRLNSC